MKAHWWSCVLGLLCMPAEVILHTWTVSQDPMSISHMMVKSSVEITCSTSLSDPMGLYLHRRFHGDRDVMYLSLKNGLVTKNNTAPTFRGRIHITPDRHIREGSGFTLHLSLLEQDDTDLYYCTWSYFRSETARPETQSSNGTIIIVTEEGPQGQCKDQILDLVLIILSVTAFSIVLMLFIGALTLRCRQFRRNFRPDRAAKPPRPTSPQHFCLQHRPQHRPPLRPHHCPYMVTSANTLDFRGPR
ncbi:uncharacterized protein [Trachinotus anak]|uniref:uncharacterized protein n=1 Tax=Trachinotus anak TaxID=443729 RepID=UPI0039F1C3B8